MLVKDIMTIGPIVVVRDDTVEHAAKQMRDADVGMLPVVESQLHKRLVGVITDRDIVTRVVAAGGSLACRVEDYMTPSPIETMYPESSVRTAADVMSRAQVRRLPVVDVNEIVVGMVTQADVARHFAFEDPQLVADLLMRLSQPVGATV